MNVNFNSLLLFNTGKHNNRNNRFRDLETRKNKQNNYWSFIVFQVIVYPTRESLNLCLTGAILLAIWIIASILASPLFIYTQLVHHDLQINGTDLGINFCIEDWPFKDGRALYSVFSIIFQYFVPIIIVSVSILFINKQWMN